MEEAGENAGEEKTRAAYARVPYPDVTHAEAQPDVLATAALLHGMDPPPLEGCRVLELGCASGLNLLPAALRLPDARFVGIDLSPEQIETGRRRVAALELGNVDLRVMSLRDVGPELGTFDYIIAHGLFSWVSAPLQDEVLRICGALLAPDGVAYVSYNTLPGWQSDLKLRALLQFHQLQNPGRTEPREIAAGALALVTFLAEAAEARGEANAGELRMAQRRLLELRSHPAYLLHDYLEDSNLPVAFHDFAARAARHGLQYLADAEPAADSLGDLPPEVSGRLREISRDRIALEQYTDFLRDRRFRRSLLCHQGITLEESVAPRRLKRLWAATETKPAEAQPDFAPGAAASFRTPQGASFSSTHGLTKAALVHLAGCWPRAVLFDDLLREARRLLGSEDPGDVAVLADVLYTLCYAGIVHLTVLPPAVATAPGELPRCSPLARLQAKTGALVTNQLARTIELPDDATRSLVAHLDGELDRKVLAVVSGKDAEWVERQLARLAELALLV